MTLKSAVKMWVIKYKSFFPDGTFASKSTAANGWREFVVIGGNAIASVMSEGYVCPEPNNRAYDDVLGIIEGEDCTWLTIVDGGPNDADGVVNGLVRDPGTVTGSAMGVPATDSPDPVKIIITGTSGGCSVSTASTHPAKHSEWWLLSAFLELLGLRKRKENI